MSMRGASLIGTSWRCTSATSFLWCVERLRHLEGGTVEPPPSKKGTAAAEGRWWGGAELAALYEEGQESLSETFCVESGKDARGQSKVDAAQLLKQGAGGNQWYASFILQKDKELFKRTINDLPVQQPSFLPGSNQR